LGDGLRGGGWRPIREWVDVEPYFFRHEHDSCAAAILRAFLWFNQATMAVIILSPPYSSSALHLSRPDARLFYSCALQCVLIYRRSSFNSNGQRELSFDLVQECNRKHDLDLVFDFYAPPSNFYGRDSESGLF